jgi:hypothetical protein
LGGGLPGAPLAPPAAELRTPPMAIVASASATLASLTAFAVTPTLPTPAS